MEIDLDAARATRAAKSEATGEGHVVKVGGQEFHLPPELPFGIVEALSDLPVGERVPVAVAEASARRIFKMLLGPEQFGRFVEMGVDYDDLSDLLDGCFHAYGLSRGEASASNGSSPNGSRPSKRISSGSTGSTSGKRAGAKRR